MTPQKQDHNLSNFWRKRNYLDGRIDWRMSAKSIHNLVRGLTRPYLGAEFIYDANTIKVANRLKKKIKEYEGECNRFFR